MRHVVLCHDKDRETVLFWMTEILFLCGMENRQIEWKKLWLWTLQIELRIKITMDGLRLPWFLSFSFLKVVELLEASDPKFPKFWEILGTPGTIADAESAGTDEEEDEKPFALQFVQVLLFM